MKHIATSLPILDGNEKVRGRLAFTGDLKIEGLLYTKLVFSTHAHARIRKIETRAVTEVPGVVAVFHHGNTPDNTYNSALWFEGQEALRDERMFPRTVRHAGDRVAAVVAETQAIADHAAALFEIDYEPLPEIFDLKVALASSEYTATANASQPFSKPIEDVRFDYGDTQAAFKNADLVVGDTVVTPKSHHCAIENHSCIARPGSDGRIVILSPCQSIFAVQIVTAQALGIPAAAIRVQKTPIGGSFGGKAEPVLEPLCAWFARTLGRPVRITFNRTETFTATRTRSKAIGTIRTAVSRDGRILARDSDVLIDVGAYCSGGHFLPRAMAQRLCRLYRIENQRFRGRAMYTNTAVSGTFRGYGSPQIHAISEINLDHTACRLGMDPVEFRLRNLIHPHAIDPVMKVEVGNARIIDCVKAGSAQFRWAERRARGSMHQRFKRGLGMACATHINGCFPAYHEATTATLRVRQDGRLDLNCALHDLGCGSNTVLAQIIAEVLDIPPRRVVFCAVDTDICDYDLGTRASRMTYICGEAVRRTAEKLKARILAQASLVLNCAPGDLSMENGGVRTGHGPARRLTLGALAARVESDHQVLAATETYQATGNPGSYAAHFAEVSVDTLTGTVRVLDYLAMHDLGRAINRQLVEGQIHGGIQMGIGYALFEDIGIDPASGRMQGDRFSRYHLANAPEMPDIEILLVEKGEPSGPFGAKAVGEIASIPVAPAIVNAVNHALNTHLSELPLSPERIVNRISRPLRGPPPSPRRAATGISTPSLARS